MICKVLKGGSRVLALNYLKRLRLYSNMSCVTEENLKLYTKEIKQFIPVLSTKLHKGQCGRIGVIGGSLEYSGAPYFSAIAALKSGADLSYVICCKEAAPIIKCYSPELIVYPYLDDARVVEKISPCLERLHALVIGPGLGRDPGVFKNVESIINYSNLEMKTPLPLVIDADGLFLITQNVNLVKNYKGPVILTPNAVEYSRLCKQLNLKEFQHSKMARTLNVVLLKKGETDVITNGMHQDLLKLPENFITICNNLDTSLRRCGGLGDLLSGCVAVFVAWFIMYKKGSDINFRSVLQSTDIPADVDVKERKRIYEDNYKGYALACLAGSLIVRNCNILGFTKFGRSMTASDMIPLIQSAFINLFGIPLKTDLVIGLLCWCFPISWSYITLMFISFCMS